MRLVLEPGDVETQAMDVTLSDVRKEIEALYAARDVDFELPARYRTLLQLERRLLERVKEACSSLTATQS
jgi:hypothetical protein